MRRLVVLGAVIVVGAVCMVAATAQNGEGPKTIAIEKLKDNLYVLTSSSPGNRATFSGGNVAVFITDAGAVIVDTKLAGWGQALLDGIKKATTKPVTTIINTHTHGDHTGNNELFGATVDSVVQENTKANMAKMDAFKGDKAKFLPKRTYKDKLTIGKGKDEVDLYYFGAGHTSGDSFVVFPAVRTMHVGDMFAWKALPYIDTGNGGSAIAHASTLAKAAASVKDVDTIIPGHIPVTTWNDFKEYADFSQDFVTFARNQMKAGNTIDQAASEYKVPVRFKGYVVTVNTQFASAQTNLKAAYDELKR